MKNKDPKQQIAEALKDAENILVTVNANPSVDELSAALGLTLLLNKLDKHATAVFSGDIPPAITFLDPEKTFENTVNSLQDFIIALDKEKADHLRYKVDGDLVKIFITPYRTTINQKDLEFSQGDYNVEAVVAIGVQNTDDLDAALVDHGRIMHDATVASISIGELDSQLGSINWREREASSYSEVVANLGEALRTDKSLLDEQIATALLTGIVAATERFSNEHTTSKSMTLAAELMAAGANQQLIATHLEDAAELAQPREQQSTSMRIDREETAAIPEVKSTPEVEEPAPVPDDEPAPDGSINISHERHGSVDEVASQVAEERQEEAAKEAEAELATVEANAGVEQQLADKLPEVASPAPSIHEQLEALVKSNDSQDEMQEPTFGGVLNATTEEAAEEKRIAEASEQNHTLLSHGSGQYVSEAPDTIPAVNSFNQPTEVPLTSEVASDDTAPTLRAPTLQPITVPPTLPAQPELPELPPLPLYADVENMTLAEIDAAKREPHEEARAEINAAFENAPSPAPIAAPEQSLPALPPMPDFSTLPPLPPLPEVSQAPLVPEITQPFQPMPAPLQSPEPAPEQTLESLLPPLPATYQAAPSEPQPFDPGQFQIPGQK